MEALRLLESWGPSAGVAIVLAVLFIRESREQRKEHRQEIDALIKNHFGNLNATIHRMTAVLDELANKL